MLSKNIAFVNQEQCAACGACETVCPKQAVAVYRGCYSIVDLNLCVGCGKCAKICPALCIELKARTEV